MIIDGKHEKKQYKLNLIRVEPSGKLKE